jgi:predicted nucleic acid-binding protein
MLHAAIARYEVLRRMKLNVRKTDLRIASIVLEAGDKLVTRNVRDFERIPGLIVENWASRRSGPTGPAMTRPARFTSCPP